MFRGGMLSKSYHLFKDYVRSSDAGSDNRAHMKEAIGWLYRAQDSTPDGGVSHSYAIGKDWAPSYPETTGYIIPTLFNWAHVTGESEARERALRMADWEISIQNADGSIPGLSTGEPVVFDTGQVLFGFVSAFENTGEEKYLAAAEKAGDWLVDSCDEDHVWRKHGNPGSDNVNLYNVRFAWALLALWKLTGRAAYKETVEGFLKWVLQQEAGRGWFRHNCLNDNARPLLHTIAYTSQGLLECGLMLNDDKCVAAAERTSLELMKHVGGDGRMPGRFDSEWRPAAKWSCVTGMAQTSIVWRRLAERSGGKGFLKASDKVNGFLKKVHDMTSSDPGIRGGVKGSFPVNGAYGRYRVLNWAAKFFVDALMLEEYGGFKKPLY
jgi:rhamnogalacturonyl hydrolase YesR